MAPSYRVQAQGVDQGLKHATGSYDPVDLGPVDAARLAEILHAVSRMQLPEGLDRGEDVCVPSLVIEGPRGLFQTNLADDEGTFYCDKLGGNIGIGQIMMVVTGEAWNDPNPNPGPVAQVVLKKPTACPSCGEKLEPGDQFCAGCGAKTAPQAPPPPPKKDRQARKKEKQANANAQFQQATGKGLEQLNNEIINLMAEPLPLRHYRERFPILLNGETDPAWETLKEYMFQKSPPPPVHARLTGSPRDWGIQKPGFFKRLLTLIVDLPVLFVLMAVGIANGPPLARVLGFGHNSAGEGVIMIGYFLAAFIGYYALTELILGASFGGLLMGLRVVDDYGRPPGIGFLIMRQVWKILDVFFMFLGGAARMNLPPTTHSAVVIPEFLPGEVVIR